MQLYSKTDRKEWHRIWLIIGGKNFRYLVWGESGYIGFRLFGGIFRGYGDGKEI